MILTDSVCIKTKLCLEITHVVLGTLQKSADLPRVHPPPPHRLEHPALDKQKCMHMCNYPGYNSNDVNPSYKMLMSAHYEFCLWESSTQSDSQIFLRAWKSRSPVNRVKTQSWSIWSSEARQCAIKETKSILSARSPARQSCCNELNIDNTGNTIRENIVESFQKV